MSAPSACLRLVSQMMTFLTYRCKIGTLFPFFFFGRTVIVDVSILIHNFLCFDRKSSWSTRSASNCNS